MADRGLDNALSSGDINGIQLGGISSDEKVLTQLEIDNKIKVTDDKLAGYVKADGSTPQENIKLIPQNPSPPYTEGQLYYNEIDGTHNLQGRYADVTLQIGREQHVEVFNNTLSPILNGTVIRYAGVTGNTPVVVPALANSFESSGGFGVTTHDIPAGETGLVTTFGRIGGLNLSAFNDGDILYLSDTVAGGLTTIPPDIVTRVGIVFNNDAVNGVLFVNPDTNSTLPTIGAYFQNLSNTTPINSVKRIFGEPLQFPLGFASTESLLIDVSSGYSFVVPASGIFSGSFVVSLSGIDPDINGHVIGFGIDVNGVEQFLYNGVVGRNDDIMSASFSAKIVLNEGDEVTMTYRELSNNNVDGVGEISIAGIQIAIESAQVR